MASASAPPLNRPLPLPAEASDYEFVGRHMMASYVGCDPVALRDAGGPGRRHAAGRAGVRGHAAEVRPACLSARWIDHGDAAVRKPCQHPYLSRAQLVFRRPFHLRHWLARPRSSTRSCELISARRKAARAPGSAIAASSSDGSQSGSQTVAASRSLCAA